MEYAAPSLPTSAAVALPTFAAVALPTSGRHRAQGSSSWSELTLTLSTAAQGSFMCDANGLSSFASVKDLTSKSNISEVSCFVLISLSHELLSPSHNSRIKVEG